MFVGIATLTTARAIAFRSEDRDVRRWATLVNVAFAAQLAIGVVNLVLLAPIPIQMLHLLFADLYWMAAVVFGTSVLASALEPATSNRSASVSASTGQ